MIESDTGIRPNPAPSGKCHINSVVIAQLRDQLRVPLDLMDHAMLADDPMRPKAGQGMYQRFGLADIGEWFALGFADQLVTALDHALVLYLPVRVVFPGLVREDELHVIDEAPTINDYSGNLAFLALAGRKLLGGG